MRDSKIIFLLKQISLITVCFTIASALFSSGAPALVRWLEAILLVSYGLYVAFMLPNRYDERDVYMGYISAWFASVVTMTLMMLFCIMDGVRQGHSNPKYVWLLSLWGITSGLVMAVLKGGKSNAYSEGPER